MAGNQDGFLSDIDLSALAQLWSMLNPQTRLQQEMGQDAPNVRGGLGALEDAATGPVAGVQGLKSLLRLLFKGGKNRGIVGTTFPRSRPTTGSPKHDFRVMDTNRIGSHEAITAGEVKQILRAKKDRIEDALAHMNAEFKRSILPSGRMNRPTRWDNLDVGKKGLKK